MKLNVHLDIGHAGNAVVCRPVSDDARTLLALQFKERLPETIIQ